MGQRLVALALADDRLQLVAALEQPQHPQFGKDAGQVAGLDAIGGTVPPVPTHAVGRVCRAWVSGCLARRVVWLTGA